MKKIYAIADSVPDKSPGLRAGVEYFVLSESDVDFEITDDDGDTRYCQWFSSNNLNGGNWRRVEREESGIVVSEEVTKALVDALEEVSEEFAALCGYDSFDAIEIDPDNPSLIDLPHKIKAALAAAKGGAK